MGEMLWNKIAVENGAEECATTETEVQVTVISHQSDHLSDLPNI